jgi:hypothetical protein
VTDRVLEDLRNGFSMVPAQMTELVRGRRIVSLRGTATWRVMLKEHG